MNLTQEQQLVIEHVTTTKGLTLIDAVAGSGKTSTLRAMANTIPHTNGLMLAYNKAIATSSKKTFPTTTNCLTTHSLAYQAVVKPNKYKVGFFGYREIQDRLPYEDKCQVADLLREFCLSEHLSYADFSEEQGVKATKLGPVVEKYLSKMEDGLIDVTHDFYLKMLHVGLANGTISYEPFDFIMLDEAGDVNPVTAEIFQLLPSDRHIAVGDPHQNIYGFNYTINCFETLAHKGKTFHLSQSFRVPDKIAVRVEAFCKAYLDPNMSFKGIPVKNTSITTRGYITRTNGALINEIIKLNKSNMPYGLTRKASEIFKLPMMLSSMKPNGRVTNPQYLHIQADYDSWHNEPDLRVKYTNPLSYIMFLYDDDLQLTSACKAVLQHGKQEVVSSYYEAKKHESTNQNYILTTAHSCKGLEFDEVTIGDDLNNSISELVAYLNSTDEPLLLPDQRESLNLYYVAVTRALVKINNALHLNTFNQAVTELQKEHYPEELI